MTRVVVVGDALLDRDIAGRVERICPDAPVPVVDVVGTEARAGGAGLAATLLAREGCRVTLVTALGDDDAGRELAALLTEQGVDVVDLCLAGATPEKIRVRANGQSLVRLDRSDGAAAIGALEPAGRRAIAGADAILVSDYGRGMAGRPDVRDAIAGRRAGVPLVWDPHPSGAAPLPGTDVVTPNEREALALSGSGASGSAIGAAASSAEQLLERWASEAVVVTLGAHGALLVRRGAACLAVPASSVATGDSCGAGDRFAGAVTHALAAGAILPEAIEGAVSAATAFVAAGGAAAHCRSPESHPAPVGPPRVVEAVRANRGTVVATGGCFDLLHAGHIAMLQAARSLGDCLVVLVNSDASVRRLKGPDRPLQAAADRCELLAALGCVDEVVVFDDDTPVAALEDLRPDVWVKGGDYSVADLPEAATLSQWGGRAVVVPYLSGRSTTRLFEEVAHRVGH